MKNGGSFHSYVNVYQRVNQSSARKSWRKSIKVLMKKYGHPWWCSPRDLYGFWSYHQLVACKRSAGDKLANSQFCLHYPIIVAKPCGYHVYIYIYIYLSGNQTWQAGKPSKNHGLNVKSIELFMVDFPATELMTLEGSHLDTSPAWNHLRNDSCSFLAWGCSGTYKIRIH